jgi:hypothetical protein
MNRRGFDAELMRMCHSSAETGELLCLVMVDIDHFESHGLAVCSLMATSNSPTLATGPRLSAQKLVRSPP